MKRQTKAANDKYLFLKNNIKTKEILLVGCEKNINTKILIYGMEDY